MLWQKTMLCSSFHGPLTAHSHLPVFRTVHTAGTSYDGFIQQMRFGMQIDKFLYGISYTQTFENQSVSWFQEVSSFNGHILMTYIVGLAVPTCLYSPWPKRGVPLHATLQMASLMAIIIIGDFRWVTNTRDLLFTESAIMVLNSEGKRALLIVTELACSPHFQLFTDFRFKNDQVQTKTAGVCWMAQQVSMLAAQPDNLSSILGFHVMEGENWLLQVSSGFDKHTV